MSPPFERVAVLGLGLLGGSVALAARARGGARHIVGMARRRGPLDAALSRGVVDAVATDPKDAVRGADLVVLASPVPAMPELLQRAAPGLAAGCVVTDVGSVKAVLCETLPGLLPAGVHYVGAHPMAGSHETGIDHAAEDLFVGSVCAITPLPGSDPGIVARVVGFWETLGARPALREAEAHDAEVAWMSHVPHVLAFAFARALAKAPLSVGELAGRGFQDFTRIAQSDAELWGDILSANRKALAAPLQAFQEALRELGCVIEEADAEAQETFLVDARSALAAVAARAATDDPSDSNARSGGENPEIHAARTTRRSPRRKQNHS